jgi:hypothetical protein
LAKEWASDEIWSLLRLPPIGNDEVIKPLIPKHHLYDGICIAGKAIEKDHSERTFEFNNAHALNKGTQLKQPEQKAAIQMRFKPWSVSMFKLTITASAAEEKILELFLESDNDHPTTLQLTNDSEMHLTKALQHDKSYFACLRGGLRKEGEAEVDKAGGKKLKFIVDFDCQAVVEVKVCEACKVCVDTPESISTITSKCECKVEDSERIFVQGEDLEMQFDEVVKIKAGSRKHYKCLREYAGKLGVVKGTWHEKKSGGVVTGQERDRKYMWMHDFDKARLELKTPVMFNDAHTWTDESTDVVLDIGDDTRWSSLKGDLQLQLHSTEKYDVEVHGPKDTDGNTTFHTAKFSGDMLRLRNDKLDFTRWGSGGISGLGVVQGFWFREIFFSAVNSGSAADTTWCAQQRSLSQDRDKIAKIMAKAAAIAYVAKAAVWRIYHEAKKAIPVQLEEFRLQEQEKEKEKVRIRYALAAEAKQKVNDRQLALEKKARQDIVNQHKQEKAQLTAEKEDAESKALEAQQETVDAERKAVEANQETVDAKLKAVEAKQETVALKQAISTRISTSEEGDLKGKAKARLIEEEGQG